MRDVSIKVLYYTDCAEKLLQNKIQSFNVLLCSSKRKTHSIKASAGFKERKQFCLLKTVNFVNCGEIFKSCALLYIYLHQIQPFNLSLGSGSQAFWPIRVQHPANQHSFKTDFLSREKSEGKYFREQNSPWHGMNGGSSRSP